VGWGEEVVGEEGGEVGEASGVGGVYSRWWTIDIGPEIANDDKCYRLRLRGSGQPSEGFGPSMQTALLYSRALRAALEVVL
jgi:hypothetical protein